MGSGDEDTLQLCIETYKGLDKQRASPMANYGILGLSLFFYRAYGLRNKGIFETLDRAVQILVIGMVELGTGNVESIDTILQDCFSGDPDPQCEVFGLIAISLIAISDPLATEMVERKLMNVFMLNSPHIKNAISLCMGLLFPSTSKLSVIEFLERCANSRDTDISSVIALGMVGAGSNSSKIQSILNTNYGFLYKESKGANALMYAQGLINIGKGLITLNPMAYENMVVLGKPIIGLLSTILLFLRTDLNFFRDRTFMLYSIIQSASPKYIVGIESEIAVGNPVETVGLTGNPKGISGAIVHSMPVLLDSGKKAEVSKNVCTEFIEDVLVEEEIVESEG